MTARHLWSPVGMAQRLLLAPHRGNGGELSLRPQAACCWASPRPCSFLRTL